MGKQKTMNNLKTKITLILYMLSIIGIHAQTKKYRIVRVPVKIKATLVAPTGKAYFFTNNTYYRQNLNSDKLEKTAVIQGNWKGVPNNVGAALLYTNGKGYFFKGNTYYRYNFYTSKVDKTALISKNWKGVPNNIDAAVVHTNGKAYFFKGSKYYRYNSALQKVDKVAEISKNWKGVPNDVEAVLRHTNGKIYFFKNNKYYRYSISSRKVDKVGTIGVDGWKGLSFIRRVRVSTKRNATTSTKKNIRLKVTLTRIKSIQARDSDDIADFKIDQNIYYMANKKRKLPIEKNIKKFNSKIYYRPENENEVLINKQLLIYSGNDCHIREGDEKYFINNSHIYEISPEEIIDKRAKFVIYTLLVEISEGLLSYDRKDISKGNPSININIYEVLDYLQNPNRPKYGKSYFKGGRAGNMHEYGAYGDVMWFKKGSNNSLIGHLEFGDNKKETYVRFYYRFELVP